MKRSVKKSMLAGLATLSVVALSACGASSSASPAPGVVAGSYDFAFGNYVSVMVAKDKGLDLKYVANGDSSAGSPDFGAVVVPADSPIKTPADLAGKTVAVNNLANT